ncbi:unnamed protein product [Acanthoscelides obtectus]|uniref:Uncharacterized protein n=1 Tax=Acanthoscelides obtectus TaxID=200917 RepID=A0A9P0JP12_ACAOB|nr:unnamed protein product [Acanthoscelides obtectus]CAK1673797.1 hypothetical protein AOBTE_LOCUS29440 [Acanthoscelides obtectus]
MSPRFKLLDKLQFTLQKIFIPKPREKFVPVIKDTSSVPKEVNAGSFLKEKVKPKVLPEEKIRLVDVKEKTTAEIERIAYESEKQLFTITERERDASVTSRLSKECEKISKDGRVVLTSTGLNVSQTRKGRKSDLACIPDYVKPTKVVTKAPDGKAPPGKGGPSSSSSDISGPTKSVGGRPTRGSPGEVLFACFPVEWWTFFVPKTGYTGFWTFISKILKCLNPIPNYTRILSRGRKRLNNSIQYFNVWN